MPEPRKEDNQPSYFPPVSKKVVLVLLGIAIVMSALVIISYVYDPLEVIEPTQQSPPNVIPATVDIPMSKENLDRCVELTIDMVKIFPYDDNKSVEDTLDDDVMDLRTEWKLLGCPSVESLITETNEWIHRNDSP